MKSREIAYLQMLAVLANSNTPRGRKNLAEELKIGEGVVRTLLEGGRDLGHVAVLKGGVKITEAGSEFLREALALCGITKMLPLDDAKKILCGRRCMGFITMERVKDVIGLRDSLVRLGACGALIAVPREGKLALPPLDDPLEKYDKRLAETLKPYVEDGGSVVIACGDTFSDALGLIALRCSQLVAKQ